ncbi:MAG: hypothetical protein ABID54_13575, partial [Pseudomonadota bacterium]
MEKVKAWWKPRSFHVMFGAMVLFWVFSWSMGGIQFSYDSWSHLSVGRYIVENLSIPKTFIFSYSLPENDWVDYEWLFQVILYQVFHIVSYKGLLTFGAILVTFTFFLLSFIIPSVKTTSERDPENWYQLGDYVNKRVIAPLLVIMMAFLILEPRLTLRPHLFEYLFLVLFLLILQRYHSGKKSMILLPLVQILWINTHGSGILGPLVIFAYLVGETTSKLMKTGAENESWSNVRRLLILFLLVSASTLINPYTYRILHVPYESMAFYLRNPDIRPLFVERQNILTSSASREILLCVTLFLASVYSFLRLRRG